MRDLSSLVSDVESLRERFDDKVDCSGNCHEWQAYTDSHGYGRIKVGGFSAKAHRVALFLEDENVDESRVLHSCHNKCCVNPNHLRLGSSSDNTQDELDRNNFAPATLTTSEVEEIRTRYDKRNVTQAELGDEYGVGQDQISRIVNRKRWT